MIMGKKNKQNQPLPGPASSAYAEQPKTTIPEVLNKKYRYYCEACSHTTDIELGSDKPSEITCKNCNKVNKFESKNILPV
jgi:hypothetical protein